MIRMYLYICRKLSAPRAVTVTSGLVSHVAQLHLCVQYISLLVLYLYNTYIHIGGIGTWPSYSIAIIPDWVLAHVQPSSYHNTLQCTKYGNKKVCNIFWLVVQYIWVNIKLLEKTCVAVKTHLLAYVLQWLLLQVPCLYHVCVPACAILISLCLHYMSLCMQGTG